MKKSFRLSDPFLERERENYTNPLPSREFVLYVLRDAKRALSLEELCQIFEILPEEEDLFRRRIKAMCRDGQITRQNKQYVIAEEMACVAGKIQGHPDGFGFLIPDDPARSHVFLTPKQMQQVLHGDRVLVKETGVDRRGRHEGIIVEVLERVHHTVVGRLHAKKDFFYVRADDRRVHLDILIAPEHVAEALDGQVVVVEIMSQPTLYSRPIGKIVEVIGEYAAPGMEIEIAVRKHQLPHKFPQTVLDQCQQFSLEVSESEWLGRKDLRHLPLVTIDGETARDFDDAVYAERSGKGFKLWVAIADVSHYVKTKTPLDEEALLRGTSVYFPRRVIPMLPEVLSNHLCSLNPNVDRLCMVCEMIITGKGEVKNYNFYPAVMHSKARLTYTTVANMLAQFDEGLDVKSELSAHILNLREVFKVLHKKRNQRGAIDFDSVETRMIFDEQGKIERIVPIERNEAHRIIEECMLAANVCAADFLEKNEHDCLYRVHLGPTPEKLENLRQFLKEFGLDLKGGDIPTPKDYAKLLKKIQDRADASLIQTVLLRSLQQAAYVPQNDGHFGLAYEAYTHFTSPIRRYPDLLVHRSIKAILASKKYQPRPKTWAEMGEHCSMTERRADDASRDVENWLKCYYMQDKLGHVFTGMITGVTGFGIFVLLDQMYVEGLVHISELGADYFHFVPGKQCLLGEATGVRFRLGDRICVQVARVDLENTKIDFIPYMEH